jgi:hypothetical protein
MTLADEKQQLTQRILLCSDPDLIRRALQLFDSGGSSLGSMQASGGISDLMASNGSMSKEEFLKRLRG